MRKILGLGLLLALTTAAWSVAQTIGQTPLDGTAVNCGALPALTGDVTTSAGTCGTTVAKIQTKTVSGTTGTGNVVFSAAPVLSGAVTGLASISIGATALTINPGGIGGNTTAASASAPGASGGKLEWRCGTNSGTLKLVAYAGTSSTGVTVLDNIGAAVTGC